MAFMSKFCFSCSVRLGSAITGVFTLVQASVLLGMSLAIVERPAEAQETLDDWMGVLRLEGTVWKEIARHPQLTLTLATIFCSCLVCSSVLLLCGCFQCKTLLLYPFALFYLLYIAGLLVTFILLIMAAKLQGHGLGDLILYSNIGGLIWLFYLYTWACVVSLIQIINELRVRLSRKLQLLESMKITNKIKVFKKNNTKGHNHARFN